MLQVEQCNCLLLELTMDSFTIHLDAHLFSIQEFTLSPQDQPFSMELESFSLEQQ